jgi:hypothetical protein
MSMGTEMDEWGSPSQRHGHSGGEGDPSPKCPTCKNAEKVDLCGQVLSSFAMEHSAEHYGQLVVYYRANNLVPPDSRR